MSPIPTTAREYAHVLCNKGESYCDYRNSIPSMGEANDYVFAGKIGAGTYSDVYDGLHLPSETPVVLKLLKPTNSQKIKKEIKILQVLSKGPNVIQFFEVVDFENLNATALIFEKVSSLNFFAIYLNLTEYDIKFYTHEILKALNYCHSMGVMHRDIKPENIVVDHERKIIKLIDWGLAQFYHPEQKYSVKVCSRYYMAPELLMKYVYYNYSLDMWSLGCIFASMLFRKHQFFSGIDMYDQLTQIVKVLGTSDLVKYVDKYGIDLDSPLWESVQSYERMDWKAFENQHNAHLASSNAYNFLGSLLCYDHVKRITAKEALNHSYFSIHTEGDL